MAYTKKITDNVFEIDVLGSDDKALAMINQEMSLGLSLSEMKEVKKYFEKLGRNPSDIEIQAVAQAWSEHSCYKSSRYFLRKYFSDTDTDYVLAKEDAGVVSVDDEYAYALRIESHNHPSAIEPYGGAATGIGGIVRDVLSMGAKPVALIDPLFFAPLHFNKQLPEGIRHPKYLFSGVVSGIRDYGNRIGVPTVSGSVTFHEGYLSNCLVNVGCIGVLKKSNLTLSRVNCEGTFLVMVGGRTGRDGIHGVNFASVNLNENSEKESRGAVQLGDPIMKEPLIHTCLECVEKGLLEGMKDLGGGGLSSVVGEIVLAGGLGAEVDLEKVKLKESDMSPWEIWVSESQERMMLAVLPENIDKVMEIFRRFDVEATVIGKSIRERVVRVKYHGKIIMDMDIEFFSTGPEYQRPSKSVESDVSMPDMDKMAETLDIRKIFEEVIAHPNVSSREWVIHQYDYEVQGNTVIKPMSGKLPDAGPSDATIISPFEGSYKGLAIATASIPSQMVIDPYNGSKNTVARAFSSILASGAIPHAISDCLNFGNPEKPEKMWEFEQAVKGIGEILKVSGIPVPSGNVSFYNESHHGSVPPTPVILATGLIDDYRRAVSTDIKKEGTNLYLIGKIDERLGGSVFSEIVKEKMPVPEIPKHINIKEMFRVFEKANKEGIILSAHDISSGGMTAALSEMLIGGHIGADIDISNSGINPFAFLFSETPFTWIVESSDDRIMDMFSSYGVIRLGTTGGDGLKINTGKETLQMKVADLSRLWRSYIEDMMG